jgi:curved DNA-binding protein CbpA
VDLASARRALGVRADDDWAVVRDAYRDQIRRSHPDVAGPTGVARSVELNAAYRVLAVARRQGRLHEPAAPPPAAPGPSQPASPRAAGDPPLAVRPEWAPPVGPAPDVRRLDHDTLVLSSTPDETFRRLVEATHEIGEISYLDRSSAIFEAVLTLDDGTAASFVVSLQWRAHDASCEAFCTLEALGRPEHLDVGGVLEQLARYIGPDRMG